MMTRELFPESIWAGNTVKFPTVLSRNNFPGISTTDFTRAQNIYADLVGLLASATQNL